MLQILNVHNYLLVLWKGWSWSPRCVMGRVRLPVPLPRGNLAGQDLQQVLPKTRHAESFIWGEDILRRYSPSEGSVWWRKAGFWLQATLQPSKLKINGANIWEFARLPLVSEHVTWPSASFQLTKQDQRPNDAHLGPLPRDPASWRHLRSWPTTALQRLWNELNMLNTVLCFLLLGPYLPTCFVCPIYKFLWALSKSGGACGDPHRQDLKSTEINPLWLSH